MTVTDGSIGSAHGRHGETTALICQLGVEAQRFAADVSKRDAMRMAVAAVENRFGQIDALIDNARISSNRCPVEEVTEEMFKRSIEVHLAGMKQRGSGSIVNLSSIQALVGWVEGATYNAAKGYHPRPYKAGQGIRALGHPRQCRCARAYRD